MPSSDSAVKKSKAKVSRSLGAPSDRQNIKPQKQINEIDSPQLPRFLSVKQLAELLHINEKKVYQLAGEGEIPCTKVTGKWLFPTQLIENWIFENSHGGVMTDRLVIAGSEDLLVQRVCARAALAVQDTAMISYSPLDTRHGLRMLEAGRVDATFINWGASENHALRHLGLLRGHRNHMNWVSVRVLQRTQGLVYASDRVTANSQDHSTATTDLLSNPSLKWALRRDTSGSMRLLQDECNARQLSLADLTAGQCCDSEQASIAAISTGRADITCASQRAAWEFNLAFLPLATVHLDLVMMRKTYFRTLLQSFLSTFRSSHTVSDIDRYQGYKLLEDFQLLTTE